MAQRTGGLRQYRTIALLVAAVLVYLIVRRHAISGDTVLLFAVLIPSIILHEVSHGALALVFGDDTAKRAGRLTLNPIPHIDPLGTVILPAILVLVGFGGFGYAKPVPVNVARLRSPRNQGLLVSLVGPAVNIVLAVAAGLAVRALADPYLGVDSQSIGVRVLYFLGFANVLLAAFNLIPIPPLDGSAVVERFLPRAWWPGYLRVRMFALPVILFVVLLEPALLSNHIFTPALNLWQHLLG